MKENVLVIGGMGFIGSHIIEELLTNNYNVIAYDNFSHSYRKISNLIVEFNYKNLKIVIGNILSYKDLEKEIEHSDYIIHLGAKISVPESMIDPDSYYETNVTGTHNVLSLARKHNIKKVLFASSCAINSPISTYAYTKLFGHYLMTMYKKIYHLNTLSLVLYNVYGERQSFDGEGAVIPKFINTLLNKETPKIYGNGNQTRDFVYVKDVAKIFVKTLKMPFENVYNIEVGSSVATTINSLYSLLSLHIDPKIKAIHEENRLGDIKYSKAHYSLAKFSLKNTSLEEGLKNTIEYYKQLKEGLK